MTYAIFKAGGRQVRASEGETIRVDRVAGEAGDEVRFDAVLLVGGSGEPRIGTPTVDGAAVVGEIVRQAKGDKVVVFKFKRRKNYARKRGHRQLHTDVRVTRIEG